MNWTRIALALLLVDRLQAVLFEGYLSLNSLNYDHHLTEQKYILAYVNDFSKCKKCESRSKLLEEVASLLPAKFDIKTAVIDSSQAGAMIKRLKILDEDCFVYLANKRAVVFRGGHSAKEISKWVKRRIVKPSEPYLYDVDFEKLEKEHPRVVSYVGKRNKYYNIFRYVSSSFEDIHFVHSFSTPVLNSRNRTVYFTKNPEKTSFFISVPFTAEDLTELINTHNNVQRILDGPTLNRIMTREDLTLLLLHTDPSHPSIVNFFKTGLKMKDRALFIASPLVKGKFMAKLIKWLGVGPQNSKPYPVLRLITNENGKMKKYEYTGAINEENLLKFYDDYQSGVLRSYFISEEVPREQRSRVKVAVGKNFESTANNKKKDVLVYFHSAICLACRDITPLFEAIAAKYSGFDDLEFVSVDNYNNEGEHIPDGTDGEPVLRMYKAGAKGRPLEYSSKWNQAALEAWMGLNLPGVKVDL